MRRPPRSRRRPRRLLGVLALVVLCAGLGATAAWALGGYHVYVVHTGSMEPHLVPGDVVVDAPVTGAVVPESARESGDPGLRTTEIGNLASLVADIAARGRRKAAKSAGEDG